MNRVRSVTMRACLLSAGAGIWLLGVAPVPLIAQDGTNAPDASHSSASGSSGQPRPGWHFFGQSKTHESTVIPPPPPPATPSASPILGTQPGRHKSAASNSSGVQPALPMVAANRTPAAAGVTSAPIANANFNVISNARRDSTGPDPEAARIEEELKRLRDNSEARRAFYEELRQIVDAVRAGRREASASGLNARTADSASPSADENPSQKTDAPSSDSPPSTEPDQSKAQPPAQPRAVLDMSDSAIDRDAYLMVVRYAKANGAPVSLALGVAWMESRLHTHPPLGGAGEVGMFQIMPERCSLEGWPSERLNEPEFNAWLGTLLLARYYQEAGSMARAAAKYVAGPGVFSKRYSKDVWAYINWYASSVDSYANYFSRYES